jgi:hypothetical protein
MPNKKKSVPKRRHPRVKKAIADVAKFRNALKKLHTDIEKVEADLWQIPHYPW